MNGDWIGKHVSLNCGPLGFYQGRVKSIQLGESTLTIGEVFRNGISSTQPHVTLRSQDIKAIKVLKSETEQSQGLNPGSGGDSPSKSVVTTTTTKKTPQATRNHHHNRRFVAENLMARNNNALNNNGNHHSSNKSNSYYRKSRDDEAFGNNNSFNMDEEFDFEKNLALFDKAMIFNELDEKLRSSPKTNGDPTKYRNDENVLASSPAQYRQIQTKHSTSEYVTDSGLIIPSISLASRQRIIESLESFKIAWDKIVELFARSTADIVLQTIGASHRLNPSNTHQIPTAIILCGKGMVGSFGLAIARLLSSHGVKTIAYVPSLKSDHPLFNSELRLYKLFDQQVTSSTKDLPQEHTGIDAVINALECFDTSSEEKNQPWFKKACQWVNTKVDPRTPIISIDPPPQHLRGSSLKHSTKITVVPGLLPFSFSEKETGKLYMVNIGVPELIFKNAGIIFSTPYGAKSAIQLHRK